MSASATSSTAATRSLTPQVLTETPNRSSASVLSPSVTATLRMLSPNRASRSSCVAAQPAQARTQVPMRVRDGRVAHVPGDGLAGHAQAGRDVAELAVAVRGLVEVHEVEVDGVPRQLDVGLRVQVQQRRAQRVEAGDPHLGRRERVHPGDHADDRVVGVGLERGAADRVGRPSARASRRASPARRASVEHPGDLLRTARPPAAGSPRRRGPGSR